LPGLNPRKSGCVTGTHPSLLDARVVARIIHIFDNEDDRIRSIVQLLGKQGITVSHMTVYRYLVSRGRIVPSHTRRRPKIPHLHVCDLPGEEVQLDVMHVDPLPGTEDPLGRSRQGFHYQYTVVDDCTRAQFATLTHKLNQDNTCEFLEETLDKSPFPIQAFRMDNGLEFQSKVRSFLQARKINYIYNRPSRPDMNGKVERVHWIDHEEFYSKDASTNFEERYSGLLKYIRHYNNERPHFGYGMDGKTPLQKLQSFPNYKTVTLIV
ncbi:DDE-type integrase/transposase/recombinase, partial [Candidatus Amesbacteria bacterium]|nr:DDE-type integrase/transposase/recombinase [Candidatus Amesbacteria bacterium]